MFAFSLAIFFGVIGSILGKVFSSGAGKVNEPLWMLGFGALFAILGAVLGGSLDIVNIIKDRTTRPKNDGQ
jgi:hypothetical protein